MALGIDPKVDFAFKLVFGSPDHTRITIHFLNAVLQLSRPITWVEILNPIQGKDWSEDKLVVLDVLAADSDGRRFNIEMQTTLPTDLPRRLTYYNCVNYVHQLSEGETYCRLRPAISICVLNAVLFPVAPEYHLSFRLRSDQGDLVFNDDLVFHTLELPKWRLEGHNVRVLESLEKWVFFLKHAEQLDAAEVARRLVDDEFREAVGVLEMISKTPEERQYYEARMKFLHDAEARLIAAREEGVEQGREQGLEQGRAEGLEQGLEKGREAGQRQEACSLVLRQLRKRFDTIDAKTEARLGGLAIGQLEDLAEALLDFQALSDLTAWLDAQTGPRLDPGN